jgi:hypothetical protein
VIPLPFIIAGLAALWAYKRTAPVSGTSAVPPVAAAAAAAAIAPVSTFTASPESLALGGPVSVPSATAVGAMVNLAPGSRFRFGAPPISNAIRARLQPGAPGAPVQTPFFVDVGAPGQDQGNPGDDALKFIPPAPTAAVGGGGVPGGLGGIGYGGPGGGGGGIGGGGRGVNPN